jgi:hypothetical protein
MIPKMFQGVLYGIAENTSNRTKEYQNKNCIVIGCFLERSISGKLKIKTKKSKPSPRCSQLPEWPSGKMIFR